MLCKKMLGSFLRHWANVDREWVYCLAIFTNDLQGSFKISSVYNLCCISSTVIIPIRNEAPRFIPFNNFKESRCVEKIEMQFWPISELYTGEKPMAGFKQLWGPLAFVKVIFLESFFLIPPFTSIPNMSFLQNVFIVTHYSSTYNLGFRNCYLPLWLSFISRYSASFYRAHLWSILDPCEVRRR